MMRAALIVTLGLTLAGCAMCGSDSNDPAGSSEIGSEGSVDRVALAVDVVREIDTNPQHAAVVLEAAGMTVEEFRDLMAEIAADEELSARYIAATPE